MRRASGTRDVLSRPTSTTRIFVTLTLAEAAALARLQPGTGLYAIQGLQKIQTAVEAAILAPTHPHGVVVEPALLRAKHHQPQQSPVSPAVPAARPRPRRPASPIAAAPADDDYTPYRDEAGGIWK